MQISRDSQGRGPRGPYRQPKSSPRVNLAIAVIRQAIRDSQYESRPYDPSRHVSEHARTVTQDTDFINCAMREDARAWLRSGEWQRTTDLLGVDRETVLEIIRRTCKWWTE